MFFGEDNGDMSSSCLEALCWYNCQVLSSLPMKLTKIQSHDGYHRFAIKRLKKVNGFNYYHIMVNYCPLS